MQRQHAGEELTRGELSESSRAKNRQTSGWGRVLLGAHGLDVCVERLVEVDDTPG